jgi:hypothetical protein
MRLGPRLLVALLLLVLLVLAPTLARWYTDWLWFGEVGYRRVFWVPLLSRLGVTLVVGGFLFVLLYLNVLPLLRRFTRAPDVIDLGGRGRLARRLGGGGPARLTALLIAAVALLVGIAASDRWTMFQQFVHAVPFGATDPLFGRDVGFFMFRLPVYQWAASFLYSWLLVSLLVVLIGSYLDLAPLLIRGLWSVPLRVRAHVSGLLGLVLLVRGWGFWLDAYGLVYSPGGVLTGAGYTDVYVVLPALRTMGVLFILAALLMFANVRLRTMRFAAAVLLVTAAAWFLGLRLLPGAVQALRVRPSELTLETPYLGRNIQGTLAGYGLTQIRERDFPGRPVSAADVADNRSTLDNVRLWDYRPLLAAYRQLQTLRQYYTFMDVDIDRYRVGAEQRQVMLAARELDLGRLPARGWVNEHLVYTHGFGLVMSPVNRISEEGMPELWIRDIPPQSPPGLAVTQPRIYFGELTNQYIVVGTRVQELDYPRGDENVYATYRGRGGIRLSWLARLAFAYRFADLKLAISSDISPRSRLLFGRNILARVQRIAPFLRYDRDPYIVVADGRLVWIIDAYTFSSSYPYSSPVRAGLNYIRNSVKVIVDAYDGTVDFYLVDPREPVARTLAGIFPELFKPLAAAPPAVAAHFRYPVDLYEIQAHVYATFHMRDPRVFYNREDAWTIPNEIFGNETVPVEPYYVTMRLEAAASAPPEFVLILPFTPVNRDNLIAWMAARNDQPHYGELVVYRFPKDALVFGPMQVESRINQDPEISQAITLWNQQGSQVIRGNLLVIPIEEGVLYVEPLFLQAVRSQLPELKRVIVSTGARINMAEAFEPALSGVLGARPPGGPAAPAGGAPGQPPAPPVDAAERDRLIREAVAIYRGAEERRRTGDFNGYLQEIQRLGVILERLAATR